MILLYKNAHILAGDDCSFMRGDLRVEGGRIVEIGEHLPGEGIDLDGKMLLPGLVDIHVHGIAGADCCDASVASLTTMSHALAKHGVTAFCPTSMTLPEARLKEIFHACHAAMRGKEHGARILGLRMEGPYLAAEKKGAQDEKYLRLPDIAEFHRLAALCPVKVIDLAPELEGALDFARAVPGTCTVSMGHTAVDYDRTVVALTAGFSHATHLFNAMNPVSARAPGVPGAIFNSNTATAELICDGVHVHTALLKQAWTLLGRDRFVSISDAMQATDMPDGAYTLGGQAVTVTSGRAQLADGTIAGGTSNLFDNLQVLRRAGISLADAVRAASLNPARVVHCDKEIGSIAVGKRADFVVTDLDAQRVERVYMSGTVVHENNT
jgi:N-acetylglucosamine-6-phosphate deacetylase